jgi:hypothetical protein
LSEERNNMPHKPTRDVATWFLNLEIGFGCI